MTRPPYPLVVSGRRRYAGPEHQLDMTRASATLIVIAVAATLVIGPVPVALVSMFGIWLVLDAHVMRTRELE